MDYLEYKGYQGSVEYSKEDDCLVGKVMGLAKETIIYEGATLDELRSDFEAGIDSYLAYCGVEGIKPRKGYSGTFNVRVSPERHSRIAMKAINASLSLNAFVRQYLHKVAMLYWLRKYLNTTMWCSISLPRSGKWQFPTCRYVAYILRCRFDV